MTVPKHLLGLKLSYLQSLPTIDSLHFDNLKILEENFRVLLSRMTIADGAKYENQVIVEEKVKGYWIKRYEYKPTDSIKHYINSKNGRKIETIDEFDTLKEAKAMLSEYQMSHGGNLYISTRCTNEWRSR